MEEIKNCENCKKYINHYYWQQGKLKKANSGHCESFRRRKFKLVFDYNFCNYWELTDNTPKQQNEDFKAILKRAAKQIEDIAAIIQTE